MTTIITVITIINIITIFAIINISTNLFGNPARERTFFRSPKKQQLIWQNWLNVELKSYVLKKIFIQLVLR